MVTGSLSELEQRRPRTVGGVLELDTNPIAAEPPQPLSVEVQLYLKDKRDGVSPGGEINSAAGRDDVVGLGGEELGDGAPPRLLLVVRARHLVLEIELHSSSLSRRLCYPVDLKGRSERRTKRERDAVTGEQVSLPYGSEEVGDGEARRRSGSSGAEQRQQEKKQNREFGLTPLSSGKNGIFSPSRALLSKPARGLGLGKERIGKITCQATSIPADRVPDMGKRQLLNLLLLGALSLPTAGMLIPYTSFFVPPGSGGSGGGTVAKDALGNDVTIDGWLKTHGPGDRTLAQGLKSLALAHVDVDDGKVVFVPWVETDFRTGEDPWWA
ncbi:hypothetical protein GW17_00034660 [Ensete ventricosum]|nr:hypothetical protein GW17_00034660 [Ensete ventricosum]